jgi:hypothetical protein
MMMRRYAWRDDQWERIKDLLPGRKETVGVTAKDNRLFVEACCTATEPASRGETYPNDWGTSEWFIPGLVDGQSAGCGNQCLKP